MEQQNQIEIYQDKDGTTQINVHFEQETVWLTQAQMAELLTKVELPIPNILIIFSLKENL